MKIFKFKKLLTSIAIENPN